MLEAPMLSTNTVTEPRSLASKLQAPDGMSSLRSEGERVGKKKSMAVGDMIGHIKSVAGTAYASEAPTPASSPARLEGAFALPPRPSGGAAAWPEFKKKDHTPVECKKFRNLIRFKFVANIMRIKRDYKSVGNTLFMASYPEYLRVRDRIAGKYDVELAKDHDKWRCVVDGYIKALRSLPDNQNWSEVCWVGSTAVDGLVSKPILDLMICTNASVEETLLAIALQMEEEEWKDNNPSSLQFPIGFFGNQGGADWGFLQMPAYHAKERGLFECNLHIFPTGEPVASEKLLMRDFLNSPDGQALKQRYSETKEKLEAKIRRGEMATAEYNKGKSSVIAEIISAAKVWEEQQRAKRA